MRPVSLATERRKRGGTLSTVLTLTALVDLFTNLVLFLLFNFSGDAAAIPSAELIRLPESLAEQAPRTTVTVMITQSEILLEGKSVVLFEEAMKAEGLMISGLKRELDYEAQRGVYFSSLQEGKSFEGRVTILADRQIPFRLLEKVMFTCSRSEFGRIDLAVIQRESQ